MSFVEVISEKKKALLAQKQLLLDNINICEKRIEEVRQNHSQAYFEADDSSDSDSGLPTPPRTGPSTAQLSCLRSQLSTCLQATQELTGLQVLESEVNVLVEPPELAHGPPPAEDGVWREATAECRVDLVPFTLTFLVHKPRGVFSPLSYHSVLCTALRPAQALELAAGGALAGAKTPSDVVQIVSSFAHAHRSRRTTLARLADIYRERLHMEAKPDGGYLLRCADVLEVSWSLQNKWSAIAPFHHRMKFDLEYMDEPYIAQIRRSHRQLLEPSLSTSERTALLAEIIDTCEKARVDMSASESEDRERSRTTLEQEPEMPQFERKPKEKILEEPQLKLKDSEVMAPPRQPPRKMKPKGKENQDKRQDNKSKNTVKNNGSNKTAVKSQEKVIESKKADVKSQEKGSASTKTAVKSQNANVGKKADVKSQQNDDGSKKADVKSKQNVGDSKNTAVKGQQNDNVSKKAAVKRPLPNEVAKTKEVAEKQKVNDPAPKQKKVNNDVNQKTKTGNVIKDGKDSQKIGVKRSLVKEMGEKKGEEIVSKKPKSVSEKEGAKKVINAKTVENAKKNEKEAAKNVDKDTKKDKAPTQMEKFVSGNVANRKISDKISDITDKPKTQETAKKVPINAKSKPKPDNVKTNIKVQKTREIPLKPGQVKAAVSNNTNFNQPTADSSKDTQTSKNVNSKIPIRKG